MMIAIFSLLLIHQRNWISFLFWLAFFLHFLVPYFTFLHCFLLTSFRQSNPTNVYALTDTVVYQLSFFPFVWQHKQRATSGENSLMYLSLSLLFSFIVSLRILTCFGLFHFVWKCTKQQILLYSIRIKWDIKGSNFRAVIALKKSPNFLLDIRIDTLIRNNASYDSFFIYVLCIIYHDVAMIATLLIIDIYQNIINAQTN